MNNVENMCDKLHILFNKMKTYTCNTIDEIPFNRGIYIFFDNNEKYKNLKRVIRVGTHGTSKDNNRLKQRLKDHFFKKDKDGSIFRLNVGKGLIKKNSYGDEIFDFWCKNFSTKYKSLKNNHPLWNRKMEIENEVSYYICGLHFTVIPFESYKDRDRFETGIISSLCSCECFKPTNNDWLGNYVPDNGKTRIAKNRLWCSDKSNLVPLTEDEYSRLFEICKAYFI